MSRVAVVTDSTASLPHDLALARRIHVQPVYVAFGDQSFRDGVDLSVAELHERLRKSRVAATTSQPTPQDFMTLFRRLSDQADGIVSIHLSSELSATLDSALAARRMMEEAGEAKIPIHIVDSRSVSMGLGLMVLAAAQAALDGKDLPQVAQAAEGLIPHMNVVFTVETLEYLRRGGRIGGAAALLGTVLDIKPVLHILNGRVEVLAKVRTRKQALARLLDAIAERSKPGQGLHVAVLHVDAGAEADDMADHIAKRFNVVELHVGDAGAVIGAHAGPGTLGVAFYGDAPDPQG